MEELLAGASGIFCLTMIAVGIGGVMLFLWLDTKATEKRALEKRLARPETRISEWKSGYRCPTCHHWTGGWAKNLGAVVCERCGSPASEYEVVKYRVIHRLDEEGFYRFDRAIDMVPVKVTYDECDYCGRKPCGCGATYNYLELEEVESV
jgi:hypothetical protein